jgi:hypothetical protein
MEVLQSMTERLNSLPTKQAKHEVLAFLVAKAGTEIKPLTRQTGADIRQSKTSKPLKLRLIMHPIR